MFGFPYSREAILVAHAWYASHWGPCSSSRALRIVRFGWGSRFEHETSDVKEAYGCIVRREHALYIGFRRLERRARGRLAVTWPGTSNLRQGERAWLRSVGLLGAVLACVGGESC
jgi:hypothetical protein